MNLVSIQLALFSKDTIDRPDFLMNKVNSELGSVFDKMPAILDVPTSIPFDLPILKVQSSDSIYDLRISRQRSDLFIFPKGNEDTKPLDTLNTYKDKIEHYYNALFSNHELTRIGFITTVFHVSDNNIKDLYEKHIDSNYEPDYIEFYLRTNKLKRYNGLTFNNVKIIEAGELNLNNTNQKGILIQFDTNTVMDSNNKISESTMADAFAVVTDNLKNIEI